MSLKQMHRITGIIVSIFIFAHLFNHLMAWNGIETHQKILDALRVVYRNIFVEAILISCFLFQSYSGVKLFFKLNKKENKTSTETIQMYSGLILGIFVINHAAAAIGQRLIFHFDTNFYFASRVVLQNPWKFFFIPYYFLGVYSFGTHIANIHKTKMVLIIGEKKAKIHFYTIVGFFTFIAITILYLLMGGHFEIHIPKQYNVY